MPSAADRWFTCAASPRFCLENADKIPADTSSRFSLEGNTAHEVAAAFLQDREPNPDNCPTEITPEMRWHGWEYAEYVLGLRTDANIGMSSFLVEQKMPLFYYAGRHAIVDAAVFNPESLHIVDYKYGEGVAVSPVENLQAIIYARQIVHYGGMVLPPEFPIFIHIYQPRNRDSDTPAKVWETTWGEIEALSDEIQDHAEVIQINHKTNGQPLDFAPSEKACRWCPAKGFCAARERSMLDGLEPLVIAEPPQELPAVTTITVEQLGTILKHKADIIKWLNDAEEYAVERMKEGHTIPDHKLVIGRGGNRYWTNPQAAAKLLLDTTILKRGEVIEEKVISVSAVEKLLGKKKLSAELSALIARPAGSPTIAAADDERDEYLVNAADEFEKISD